MSNAEVDSMKELRQSHFRLRGFHSATLLLTLCFATTPVTAQAQASAPPETRQDNVKETIHGIEIIDPYRWLEDQDSKETRDWVAAQNAYTHAILDGLPMRITASTRLMEMLHHDTMGAPLFQGGYYFFTKKGADQDLSSIYRRKGSKGEDELLIDP